MKEDKLIISNNYCVSCHNINEHKIKQKLNVYKRMQKCLLDETFCLENNKLIYFEKWMIKE